jgi:hypothetical protein
MAGWIVCRSVDERFSEMNAPTEHEYIWALRFSDAGSIPAASTNELMDSAN